MADFKSIGSTFGIMSQLAQQKKHNADQSLRSQQAQYEQLEDYIKKNKEKPGDRLTPSELRYRRAVGGKATAAKKMTELEIQKNQQQVTQAQTEVNKYYTQEKAANLVAERWQKEKLLQANKATDAVVNDMHNGRKISERGYKL